MRTASLFAICTLLVGCQIDEGAVIPTDTKACGTTENYVSPVAGTPQQDWYISNYVDIDPTAYVFADYRGGFFTYDQHRGVDIALLEIAQMEQGVAVLAARCGVVTAFRDSEYDQNTDNRDTPWNFVEISHPDGSTATYGHLKQNSVDLSLGQYVDSGDQIGLVGSSGNSSGPHLHFEVTDGFGQVVDIFAQGVGFEYGYADTPVMLDSGITVATDPGIQERDFFLVTPAKHAELLVSEEGVVWLKILGLKHGNKISIELASDTGKRAIIGQLDATTEYKASFWYWTLQQLPPGNYQLTILGEQETYKTHVFSVTNH